MLGLAARLRRPTRAITYRTPSGNFVKAMRRNFSLTWATAAPSFATCSAVLPGDPDAVLVWERPLGIRMDDLQRQYTGARETASRDWKRGYVVVWGVLIAAIWLVALGLVWIIATRFSGPIANLTEALRALAGGDFRVRVPNDRTDEIGLATQAFNPDGNGTRAESRPAGLSHQLAEDWQILARKMAHEVKNSLTPIRLTVEEMVARERDSSSAGRRAFLDQAASIVVDEI